MEGIKNNVCTLGQQLIYIMHIGYLTVLYEIL